MTNPPDAAAGALVERLLALPRRYRMPALPPDLAAAVRTGNDATIAFALEAARVSVSQGAAPATNLREAFEAALAATIQRAISPAHGDPMFQAAVLQSQDAQVQQWLALEASAISDARNVRGLVDAFAHPGKLHDRPQGAGLEALAGLHALARAGDWLGLAAKARSLAATPAGDPSLRASLQALVDSVLLQRRGQAQVLAASETVRRYQALRAQRTPAAGSDAALARGRAAAHEGEQAEEAAALAMQQAADFLNAGADHGHAPYRVLRSLRTPRELTDGAPYAKEEWDVAIVRNMGTDVNELVLMAEVKAAPTAAAADLSRLVRGLAQLANAQAGAAYAFACDEGAVRLSGSSLRALQPSDEAVPPQVIYLCSAPVEPRTPVLDASSKTLLLADAASLHFAAAIGAGASPDAACLAPVWDAVTSEPRMRSVLHQYDTARRAREIMLNTGDVVLAVAQRRGSTAPAGQLP